jgi:tRNA (mo5U34)-methyltransferase
MPYHRALVSSLQERIGALPWFHQIDLGGGVITPGVAELDVLRMQADMYFKDGIEGLSLIDVGCWDGFNSFEARRRGAAHVLAIDHFAWSEQGWGSQDAFLLAREALQLEVDVLDIDLMDLTRALVGMFDIVLFAGVLYHMRHPFLALERVSELCSRTLIVETQLDALEIDRPAMIFYRTDELGADATNWWGPNPECVTAMLTDLGFASVEFNPHPHPRYRDSRGIFHAHRHTAS